MVSETTAARGTMNIGRAAFKLFVSRTASSGIYFLGIVYFARQLDAGGLGSFFLFLALLGILSLCADLGVRWALEKRLSEGMHPERTLGSALVFKSAMLSVVSLGILLARPYISGYLGENIVPLLVLTVVLREFAKLYIQALRGELRVEETATIEFVRRAFEVGIGAVLITWSWGVRGLVYGSIVGWTVALLWARHRCTVSIGRPSVEHVVSLLTFSKYQTIIAVGGRVYQWMDIAFIGLLLTQAQVSAYELSWQVTVLVLLVSKSVATTIFPQISLWNERAETDHIESTISRGITVALFFSLPALVGALLYATEILELIFGVEYAIASTVLVVLMVEKQFQAFHDIIEGTVRAIDRPDLAARATVFSVSMNFILTPLLVVSVGLVGAAVATTASWFVNTVLHTHYLSRYVRIDVPVRLIGWFGVVASVMGGALLVTKQFFPVTTLPVLFIHVCTGVVVYGCAASAIPAVRRTVIAPGLERLYSEYLRTYQ